MPHDQPTYAGLPGINVFGMICVPYNSPSSFFGKWQSRPVIHTSYRSKNTTIEAATNDNENVSSVENWLTTKIFEREKKFSVFWLDLVQKKKEKFNLLGRWWD